MFSDNRLLCQDRLGTNMETPLNRFAAGRELYSHVANPVPLGNFDYEAENLVDKPEHKELVAALSEQLHSGWRPQLP